MSGQYIKFLSCSVLVLAASTTGGLSLAQAGKGGHESDRAGSERIIQNIPIAEEQTKPQVVAEEEKPMTPTGKKHRARRPSSIGSIDEGELGDAVIDKSNEKYSGEAD